MKRIFKMWPEIVISGFVTLLSTAPPTIPTLRIVSLAGVKVMGLSTICQSASVSPVRQAYLLYFVVNAFGFWILPDPTLHLITRFPASILYACLLALAILPGLFGDRYFTAYFAKKSTPAAVWDTNVFKAINRNMSWMWSGLFAASLFAAAIPGLFLPRDGWPTAIAFQVVLPGVLMLGVGVRLNQYYPAYYKRRMGIDINPLTVEVPDGRLIPRPIHPIKEDHMARHLKVVAINGSPHKQGGNTSIMTQMLASRLAEEDIELEEICLADRRIEFCVGCGLCTEKGACWRRDDHARIIDQALRADGLILASPVYFGHVTAQMKVFIDRSLAYGHKPRGTWKPGLAISVSAGKGETATADYLAGILGIYGAFAVGNLTAIAVNPGGFMGKDLVEARAADLAADLARAISEKRRFPATDRNLLSYLFMADLVKRQKDFMRDDYRHWEAAGFYDGFERYMGQYFTKPPYNEDMRKHWIKEMIAKATDPASAGVGPTMPTLPNSIRAMYSTTTTCLELLKAMPGSFNRETAGELKAVFQFKITGTETFDGYLVIADGRCTYAEGVHAKPDVTIHSPAQVWLAISRGEMNGQMAFMSGKYRVEGDLSLLMKLGGLFSRVTQIDRESQS
jgi:multimeric flavodoxin WrbA/putative sterol carrier protein